jgi:hypothetical protein
MCPTVATGTLPGRSARDNAGVCSLCGTLYSTRHWAEAPGDGAEVEARRAWMRDRLRRVGMLNRVLGPLALSVDEWEGTAYVLRTRTGESVLCADLATLFVEAQRLARKPLDPLDPGLLDRLGAAS